MGEPFRSIQAGHIQAGQVLLSRKGLAIAGEPMSDFFHPKLQAVEALASYRLRTTWSIGEVLDVDVESVLRGTTALTKLLETEGLCRGAPCRVGPGH